MAGVVILHCERVGVSRNIGCRLGASAENKRERVLVLHESASSFPTSPQASGTFPLHTRAQCNAINRNLWAVTLSQLAEVTSLSAKPTRKTQTVGELDMEGWLVLCNKSGVSVYRNYQNTSGEQALHIHMRTQRADEGALFCHLFSVTVVGEAR